MAGGTEMRIGHVTHASPFNISSVELEREIKQEHGRVLSVL
jgi:hypothetical protein